MSVSQQPTSGNRYGWQALATLILIQLFLLTVAAFYPAFRSYCRVVLPGGDTLSLRYYTLAEILDLRPPQPTAADSALESLLAGNLGIENELDSLSSGSSSVDSATVSVADSLIDGSYIFQLAHTKPATKNYPPTAIDSALEKRIRISNPTIDNNSGKKVLDLFFEALYRLETHAFPADSNKVIRVAHYGDSQIEGDRISLYLRQNLQQRFGGCGLGLVPLTDIANHHAVHRTVAANWRKFTVFKDRYINGFYGLSGTVFRFQPATRYVPATDKKSTPSNKKREQYDRAKFWFSLNPWVGYDKLSLFWGKSPDECLLTVWSGDSVVCRDTLPPSDDFHITELPINGKYRNMTFEVRAAKSPDFYGIGIDGNSGIQVDNYGIRGHSGNGLVLIDDTYLKIQIQKTNTKLFIFQFGGNVVPYPSSDFKWLENDIYRLLMKYKKAAPQAAILVVGVADMGTANGYSYSTVPGIRDAQKRAAERAGCAFWDLYEIMGAKNSVFKWARQRPSLMAPDLAHFSNAGQKLIGNLLYKALMIEYQDYKERIAELPKQAINNNSY